MFGKVNREQLFARRENGEIPVLVLHNRKFNIPAFFLPAKIGRNQDEVDMYLFDPSVSRAHAVFELYDGKVIVTDMNSTMGTSINKVRLEQNTPFFVEDGDKIEIGNVKLTCYVNYDMLERSQQPAAERGVYEAPQTQPPMAGQGVYGAPQDQPPVAEQGVYGAPQAQPPVQNSRAGYDQGAYQNEEPIEEGGTSLLFPDWTSTGGAVPVKEITDFTVLSAAAFAEKYSGTSEGFVSGDGQDDNGRTGKAEEKHSKAEPIEIEKDLADDHVDGVPETAQPGGEAEGQEMEIFDDEGEKTEVLSAVHRTDSLVPMQLRWINQDGDKEDVIAISKTPFVVGRRLKETDYAVNAKGVSHRHFFIDETNGVYYITDLKSTNGVRINGEKIKPMSRRQIEDGDIVGIGEREYRFERA